MVHAAALIAVIGFAQGLDRGLTETMLDAGALDPRRELAADLLGSLPRQCRSHTPVWSPAERHVARRIGLEKCAVVILDRRLAGPRFLTGAPLVPRRRARPRPQVRPCCGL